MNGQNEVIAEKQNKKKKITKRWWFWVIIIFLGMSLLIGVIDDGDVAEEDNLHKNNQSNTEENTSYQISEEEYKSSCKTYAYKDMARNPDNYKGENITLKGEVIQVLESGKKIEMRVNMNNDYDQTFYVLYTLKSNEGRILENDIVKIYGNFEGLMSYKSVLGAEITLPLIDAKYIEIIE